VTETNRKRKLIEVALPLDEINAACKADKDRKTGTIRNLHKWFAPMPLPAWRALLFAALIDDPEDDNKRVYLLDVIKRLVKNGADLPDKDVLDEAKVLLAKQYPDGVPAVLDPFCGGGSTLIEAQRLGVPAYGSDLNPVPALITRTISSMLPRVQAEASMHKPASGAPALFSATAEAGYAGLISDVSHYATKVRERAWAKLSPYYPGRSGETPVAWIWARTARCPNPACGIETVLTTSWWLSKKKNDLAWIEPTVVDGHVELAVVSGQPFGTAPESPKTGRGASFQCVACKGLVDENTLMQPGALGLRLMAVAAEQGGRRIYRAAHAGEQETAMSVPVVDDLPELRLPDIPRWFSGPRFGFNTQADLYTPRQLLTLTVFSDLVSDIHEEVRSDGGSVARADAITTLLALSVGKMAQVASTLAIWRHQPMAKAEAALSSHSLPMMWDFPDVNVFGDSVGDWRGLVKTTMRALALLPDGAAPAEVARVDARRARLPRPGLVATDPPYFDAIGYADISDYFYLWHRRSLRNVHPDLYGTLATPKSGELTAVPAHHGNDKSRARDYFVEGFTETFGNLKDSVADDLPMLIVYASKEQKGGKEEETRWSSILTAMINADLEITGTWPVRGTTEARMISAGTNAVASYIVMVCRPRSNEAGSTSLAEFNRALRRELGPAVRDLQAASILPVDLAQAAMGPGMQIYSRYRAVLDQSGQRVPVEQALRLINAALGEVLEEQEGELDPESRFAVRWWDAHGWISNTFGEADKTVRPLGISVDDVVRAQVATSQANKVQLLGAGVLDYKWVPSADIRPTAWEAVHHLAHRLIDRGGELEAAQLMAVLGNLQDPAMALVYRLHDIAAKKGRTGDQERYNALINSWAELVKLSSDSSTMTEGLF
jgi:putative DNA methylase